MREGSRGSARTLGSGGRAGMVRISLCQVGMEPTWQDVAGGSWEVSWGAGRGQHVRGEEVCAAGLPDGDSLLFKSHLSLCTYFSSEGPQNTFSSGNFSVFECGSSAIPFLLSGNPTGYILEPLNHPPRLFLVYFFIFLRYFPVSSSVPPSKSLSLSSRSPPPWCLS